MKTITKETKTNISKESKIFYKSSIFNQIIGNNQNLFKDSGAKISKGISTLKLN